MTANVFLFLLNKILHCIHRSLDYNFQFQPSAERPVKHRNSLSMSAVLGMEQAMTQLGL